MAVIIGSARSDENNRTTGGKPGDQKNGLEVSTQEWYLHAKGWNVIRAKDSNVAERLAWCMEHSCNNNHIGYNQDTSYQLYDAIKTKGFNPDLLTIDVNTDCSSLVRVCCAYAGINLPWFSTLNELQILLESGKFEQLKDSKYETSSTYLRRGDILVTKTKGHTVIVLTDGTGANPKVKNKGEAPQVSYKKCLYTGKIIIQNTYCYTAPRNTSEIQSALPVFGVGNLVECIGQTYDGSWTCLNIYGAYGWVQSNAIVDAGTNKVSKACVSYETPSNIRFGAKANKYTKVYTKPSFGAPISPSWGELGVGNEVDVIGCSSDMKWVFLNIQGAKGWIPTSCLTW